MFEMYKDFRWCQKSKHGYLPTLTVHGNPCCDIQQGWGYLKMRSPQHDVKSITGIGLQLVSANYASNKHWVDKHCLYVFITSG